MKRLGFIAMGFALLAGIHATATATQRLVLIEYYTNVA